MDRQLFPHVRKYIEQKKFKHKNVLITVVLSAAKYEISFPCSRLPGRFLVGFTAFCFKYYNCYANFCNYHIAGNKKVYLPHIYVVINVEKHDNIQTVLTRVWWLLALPL